MQSRGESSSKHAADPTRRADGDLQRTRLTVFFRLLLALPRPRAGCSFAGVAAFVVAFVNWLAVLIQGEAPDSLHDFVASYVRYATQVSAYVFLAADPYPWFRCQADYPIDLEIDPPVRQGRWGGFFRLVLALPALLLATALGGGFATGSSSQGSWTASSSGSEDAFWWNVSSAGGVAAAAAFLAWFAILALGRAPRGLRDLTAFALGYAAQAGAYLFLLTPRYPTSDPALAEPYYGAARSIPSGSSSRTTSRALGSPSSSASSSRSRTSSGSRSGRSRSFFAVFVAWIAALVTGPRPGRAASLPRRLRPLRDAPHRVRLPHRPPLPGLHRPRRARTGSTSRSIPRRGRAAGRRCFGSSSRSRR